MTVKVIVGDAREALKQLPDESVHCCITSPPYWGLRAYKGDPGMIGLERGFDEHLWNLAAVFREVRRVLRSDGTLWLNYGDGFSHGGNGSRDPVQWPKQSRNDHRVEHSKRNSGFKPKDLMMMPARVAMALQADGADMGAVRALERAVENIADAYEGTPPDKVLAILEALHAEYAQAKGESWWLRSEIIWHKPNPMPESVTDRPTSAHEKLFLLTKAPRYFYDAEAVRVPAIRAGEIPGGDPYRYASDPTMSHSKTDTRFMRTNPVPTHANLRNVWSIATFSFPGSHFATFPPALVEPCIKAGTSERGCCPKCGAPWGPHDNDLEAGNQGGKFGQKAWDSYTGRQTLGWSPSCACDAGEPVPCTVIDPFGGSGTVGLVADRLGRDAIVIEISETYADMARGRISGDAPLLVEIEQ